MIKKADYTRENYDRDRSIVDFVERQGIDFSNTYEDVDLKRDLLKKVVGLKNLRSGKDSSRTPYSPVDDCGDAQVAEVALKYYDTALKRLEEYRLGERVLRDVTIKNKKDLTSRLPVMASSAVQNSNTEQLVLNLGMSGYANEEFYTGTRRR
ncbi:MAG: hypothetical protein AABX48_03120 [Nanoarchaeota archaeon]